MGKASNIIRLNRRGFIEIDGSAMHHGVHAPHRRLQRAVVEQIAPHNLHPLRSQSRRTARIPHQRTDVVIPKRQALYQPAPHLPRRSRDQHPHAVTISPHPTFHNLMGVLTSQLQFSAKWGLTVN